MPAHGGGIHRLGDRTGEARGLLTGECAPDAGEGKRPRRVDSHDPGVAVRASQDRRMKQSRDLEVVEILAPSGQKAIPVEPALGSTDMAATQLMRST